MSFFGLLGPPPPQTLVEVELRVVGISSKEQFKDFTYYAAHSMNNARGIYLMGAGQNGGDVRIDDPQIDENGRTMKIRFTFETFPECGKARKERLANFLKCMNDAIEPEKKQYLPQGACHLSAKILPPNLPSRSGGNARGAG